MTTATRITNDKIATEFLAVHSPGILDEVNGEGVIVLSDSCHKCGGIGRGPWRQDGGICYKCGGADTTKRTKRWTVKQYAQRIKASLRREEKARQKRIAQKENMIEGQRNWCEKNGHGRLTFAELDQKRAVEREASKGISQHVGEVKKRQEFNVTLEAMFSFDGAYGIVVLHKFKDSDGNVIVWRTNDWLLSDEKANGQEMTIVATVKKHDAYDGEKQTYVTRVKKVSAPVEAS